MKFDFNKIDELKSIPTHLLDTKCIACGKDNPEGLKMHFHTDEQLLYSKVHIREHKRGWEQVVHGGILSTILDEVMAWTAIYFTRNFMLTKSININYIHPIHINTEVVAVSWIESEIKHGKELLLKSQIYNSDKKLCTEAVGSFAIFSKKLASKLKLMSEDSIDNFDNFLSECFPNER